MPFLQNLKTSSNIVKWSSAISILWFLAITLFWNFNLFEHVNQISSDIDYRVRNSLKKGPHLSEKIKIYAFDDKSVKKLQRTDLYIDEWASILEVIAKSKPRKIIVDKLFSIQNDPYNRIEDAANKIRKIKSNIAIGGVSAPSPIKFREPIDFEYAGIKFRTEKDNKQKSSSNFRIASLGEQAAIETLVSDRSQFYFYGPAKNLVSAFPNIGMINYGGKGKIVPFMQTKEKHILPHLSLYAANVVEIKNNQIFIDGYELILNRDKSIHINLSSLQEYQKKTRRMQSLLSLVESGKTSSKINEDDVVLLLPSFNTGSTDFHSSPLGYYPGGFLVAAAINSVLTGQWLKESQNFILYLVVLCLLGALMTIFFNTTGFIIILLSIAILIVIFGLYQFIYNDTIIPWASLLFSFLINGLSTFGVKFRITEKAMATEREEKKRIKDAFSCYLSKDVLNELIAEPEKLKLGGVKKNVSIFFSDVRGFTTISEKLDPQELCFFMNEYLTPMTDIIIENGGVLDKYIGDAIMAFWGAPIEAIDHPNLAAKSTLQMLYALEKLNHDLNAKGLPPIDIGIGLNTGAVSVGNMGSHTRFCYTIMGDAVNLGARLEGLTKFYGIKTLISQYTKQELSNDFYVRDIDDIRVKGKLEPVKIFELMRPDFLDKHRNIIEFIDLFSSARVLYKYQKWDEAIKFFKQCLSLKKDDGPARMYVDRIAKLSNLSLSEDWEGIWDFEHK